MKILLDIDGVTTEYNFPKLVKNFFGVDISKYQIYAYDLADVLGVSPMMINNMFKEQVYGKPTFTEGALETLNEWYGKNEIIIYSNRTKYMKDIELVQWLIGSGIPFNGISIEGKDNCNYCIDDSPAKLMNTICKRKLLFTQPWNKRCMDITHSLERVNSWREIREIVGGDV